MHRSPQSYRLPSQADLFHYCTSSTSEDDIDLYYAPPSRSSLRIGVVILGHSQHQLFDIAAIDLLCMVGRSTLQKLNPSGLALTKAVDEVDIRYINESGDGSFSITSGLRLPVTNSFENAPELDIIVVPGTYASEEVSLRATKFLAAQAANPSLIAILSISSGISSLVQTGLLHQKKATAPSSLLPRLRQLYPETLWRQASWEKNQDIWTSSSAMAAIEMLAAFMRRYFWDRSEAVECALSAAGIAPLST